MFWETESRKTHLIRCIPLDHGLYFDNKKNMFLEKLQFYTMQNIFSIFYVLHFNLLTLFRYRIILIVMTRTGC